MKVNFRKVPVQDIEGQITDEDMATEFGNYLYNGTADISDMDLAKKIYYDGEVELSDEQANRIIETVNMSKAIIAKYKVGLLNILNNENY